VSREVFEAIQVGTDNEAAIGVVMAGRLKRDFGVNIEVAYRNH